MPKLYQFSSLLLLLITSTWTNVQSFTPLLPHEPSSARAARAAPSTTSFYLPPTKHWYETTDTAFTGSIFPDDEFVYARHHTPTTRQHPPREEVLLHGRSRTRHGRIRTNDNGRLRSNDRAPVAGDQESRAARVVAAGLGTGVIGLLVCGNPIGATVLGFSAAFCAETNQDGVVGDSARAVGDVALSAKNKATEIDEKHRVVEKTIVGAGQAWEKAKELDRQHKIVQKAKDLAVYSSTATVDFVRRHNLIERGVRGLGQSVGWLNERVVAGSLSPAEDIHEQVSQSSLPSSERNAYKGVPRH